MEPRVSVLTLGVHDLQRAIRFYRDGLGWPMTGDGDGVAFFQLGGLVLSLYPYESLAEDACLPATGSGFGGIALAQCVRSKAEADEVLAAAERAGGTLLKPAQDVFWGGYSGYFQDTEGYAWEVAWNPGWELTPDGAVKLS
ncbi:MAG: VOC family protein [Chloroflexi bacterium]|nr:VOC family protein [Chloroflexota bacterium]